MLTQLFATFALLIGFAAISNAEVTVGTEEGSGVQCFDLIAGKNEVVGTVCVTANHSEICFEFTTTGDWVIEETHLWAGLNTSEMPQNRKGNPKLGHFPHGDIVLANTYKTCVPLSELGLSEAIICKADQLVLFAAHAAVSRVVDGEIAQEETAWSDGDPITDKGSWGMIGSVTLTCECTPEPPTYDNCETAFAVGATTLDSLPDPLDPTKPLTARWGWQIGPVVDVYTTYPIYAGAGQNDLAKGIHVGTLHVWLDGGTVDVVYEMLQGYMMTETHLYVGDQDIGTAAPGQFGNTHENLDATVDAFSVDMNDAEQIHIVAHAVVCEIVASE